MTTLLITCAAVALVAVIAGYFLQPPRPSWPKLLLAAVAAMVGITILDLIVSGATFIEAIATGGVFSAAVILAMPFGSSLHPRSEHTVL